MADEGTFATTSEIQYKAGSGASLTSKQEAYTNVFIKQAESFINVVTKYNWTDNYASLNADVQHLLKEAASNLAAVYVIAFDMASYPTRYDAETLMNVLYERAMACIELLAQIDKQDFIKGA